MTHLRLVTPLDPVPTFHLRDFGEQVVVLDSKRRRETTGRIVGRVRMTPAQYDVLTEDGKRLCGIPEDRLVGLDRL
jgi:hypothetical protein